MEKAHTVTNAIERFYLQTAGFSLRRTCAHKSGAGCRTVEQCRGWQKSRVPHFHQPTVELYHMKWTPPPHTHSCINIMQLWASEKLLMQRGNPYFCQSPHLKCNQRHSGGSWNLNQHQNSRREGPGVLYCTRPAGEALISIANSINSGRGVLFISLKKKLSRGEKKANWKSAVIFMVPQKSYTRV